LSPLTESMTDGPVNSVTRCQESAESLAKARREVIEGEAIEEVRGELVAAS
jgi:hypothetical protein